MERAKRILVAPLDWGLGHATRCIPLIQELLKRNCKVYIASSGSALLLLQHEFPVLGFFDLPAYNPVYPVHGSMVWKMGRQLPKFLKVISTEHAEIEKLIRRLAIDVLISDNRYGCYSKVIPSYFIYHQLRLIMPAAWKWMEPIVNYFNQKQIRKFTECWIPASPQTQFLISLSEVDLRKRYIGFLSRFEKCPLPKEYAVLAICSGPEPQRSIFERLMKDVLRKTSGKTLLVKGILTGDQTILTSDNCSVVNFLTAQEMNEAIEKSKLVISRAGYSSIMDLAKLGAKAILIPTPGQTEQEYLAAELKKNKIAYSTSQSGFNLETALHESKDYSGFVNFASNDDSLLRSAVDSIL